MNAPHVVLLTATIAPSPNIARSLTRADPEQRLHEYAEALRFWLGLREPWLKGIVFAENSGYTLDGLKQTALEANAAMPVEFLSFAHPPPPTGLHYGYSEFVLVREALAASQLAREVRYFIKATGRYTFPDIGRLVRTLPASYRVAVDARGQRRFQRANRLLVSVALALFEIEYFRSQLASLPETMVPAPPWTRQQFIEPVLFDYLYPKRHDNGIVLRWPVNCEPRGFGANGDNYASFAKRSQAVVRAFGRRVIPSLWM